MTQSNIKFIAADMDGTLLDPSGQLDPTFFDMFERLKRRKIIFAAASGRQYYSLLKTFEPVKDQMMFVAENGTMVLHKGEELYSCTMETTNIDNMIRTARTIEGAHIVLCGKQSAYIETQDQQALDELRKYYEKCQYVEDLTKVDDKFIKVAICHFGGSEEHVYPLIKSEFGHDHKVVVSAKFWLDIMHPDASKGTAIKHLQETLDFSHEQTMSFGDYFNDIEMLQVSYHSYAVENAHEEVKKHARYIAPSNAESGVLKVLKEVI